MCGGQGLVATAGGTCAQCKTLEHSTALAYQTPLIRRYDGAKVTRRLSPPTLSTAAPCKRKF